MSNSHLRVAFASPEHARAALKILAALAAASLESSQQEMRELTVLEIDAAVAGPDHTTTLVREAHPVMCVSTQVRAEVA